MEIGFSTSYRRRRYIYATLYNYKYWTPNDFVALLMSNIIFVVKAVTTDKMRDIGPEYIDAKY